MKPNETSFLPVIVAGVRTPFMRSHKAFVSLSSCDLGRHALSGLMNRCSLGENEAQHLIMGTVIHDSHTPNIGREALLAAGLSPRIPAHTVSLACVSSNMAATQIADMIRLGQIDCGIASGVDTCSDPPIRISKGFRKTLARWQKLKGMGQWAQELVHLKNLEWGDLSFDVPSVKEFSNGKTMGQGCEILAQQAGITREEADRFAARSHELAHKAWEKGTMDDHVLSMQVAPAFKTVKRDDGPRGDTTVEKLSKLSAAFDKQFGVSTAGNSSFLTDGASAMLIMSLKRAQEAKRQPMAIIRDAVYRAGDALYEMLSGPAMTIPALLQRNGLKTTDVEVWEIHEAFAAQVLANLKLISDAKFCRERLQLSAPLAPIPIEKINTWGGSLSIGHPFGATGVRLLYTAAKRLQEQGVRYAVVSGCAAGGHGSAILLENPNFL